MADPADSISATPAATAPATAAPISVSVHAARLVFGGEVLFEDLDITLEGGAITCLLGPSGVGKSSLLRMLAGLAPSASAGSINRFQCSDGRPLAGRLAYMDQRDLLLPWLSVIDNVTVGSRLRGVRADRERARTLLERVGLGAQANDRPASLSGGMRQRVALARTLMEDRPVVLMDEPFSALDAISRFRIQALAAGLLAERTVLLVTHDPFEALRLGHRIHVMAGRPARLDQALTPPHEPPRDPTSAELMALHGDLLRRLAAADEAAP
ncbi:MAG: ABC transporter ATP-binding protein [Alphaproteobacteria bacterium]